MSGDQTLRIYTANGLMEEMDRKGIHQVRGTLCALDLFRRLRARPEARGADGIEDPIAGSHLVAMIERQFVESHR